MKRAHVRPSPRHDIPDDSLFLNSDVWHVPAADAAQAEYKEWSYFFVAGADFDLLVAFSLFADAFTANAAPGTPRVLVMLRDESGWHGGVCTVAHSAADIRAGRLRTRCGDNTLDFLNGAYALHLNLPDLDFRVGLTLAPQLAPAVMDSVRLSAAGPMRWLVVPRLRAEGWLWHRGRARQVPPSPAYHDRNWGQFAWGAEFSWEWIALLPETPEQPWSMVYWQIGDRSRHRYYSRGLMVWWGAQVVRTFHADALDVTWSGRAGGPFLYRVPAIAGLASQGHAADVPARIVLHASAGADSLQITIEHGPLAAICLPHDHGPGLCALLEASGRATLSGQVAGHALAGHSRCLSEFHHDAV